MLYLQPTMTSLTVLAGLCFREVKSFVPFPRRDSKRKNTLTMSPWPHDCSADAPTGTAFITDGAPVYSKHWIQASNQCIVSCCIFFQKSKGCTPLFFCIQSLIMLCTYVSGLSCDLIVTKLSGVYRVWNVIASWNRRGKMSQTHIQLKFLIT